MLVQVFVGSRQLHSSVLTSPGSYQLTVNSPMIPLTGHLQLRCHTRHAKLLHDTISVTYVQTYCLSEVGRSLSWPAQNHSNVGDTVALLAGHQTCNLQVVGSSADSAPLHSGVGQATYTYLLL